MKQNKKKRTFLKILAFFALIAGAAVAVVAFLRKKAEKLGEELDYEGELYYTDDEDEDEASDFLQEDDNADDAADNGEAEMNAEPDDEIDAFDEAIADETEEEK